MSRIGKNPIPIPQNVKVRIDGAKVIVDGPQGKLETSLPEGIQLEIQDGLLIAKRAHESQAHLHGLVRALVANSIVGITQGFKKELDIVGIGYRAEAKEKTLICTLGYSHPMELRIPEGISITVDRQTRIVVSGIDKQKVGQVAADIRALRPPDPYKNKGIRYVGEVLRKKAGKGAVTSPK